MSTATNLNATYSSRFPDITAPDPDLIDFKKRYFAFRATQRSRHMQRFSRNIFYDLNRQWIELDSELMIDGARGFAWRDMQATEPSQQLPQPVTNIIAPSIDVEFATLAKRQWEPKLVTFSRDPRAEAATKVKDDILRDRLKKLLWEDLRDEFIRSVITCGTGLLWSYWDESFVETTWISKPGLVRCIQCDQKQANALVPPALRGGIPQGALVADLEDGTAVLKKCPSCGGDLLESEVGEDEVKNTDMFGRTLGEERAKGGTQLELLTPFEYYPENGGIVDDPMKTRVHGICKIRHLDWIEEHYPGTLGIVERETPDVLWQQHPTLGNWDVLGRMNAGLDSSIYDCHARVFTLYADPSMRYPKGRVITIVGDSQDLVVENGDLITSYTDQRGNTLNCPKGTVAVANWKNRKGEFWGKGLPDDLISPQNRLNGIDAQVIEARERMGSPNLMTPEGADLVGPEYRQGYGAGKVFTYIPSPLHADLKPEVFGAIDMPAGVNQEREQIFQDVTRIVGPADIEIGEAPRNITTTSGLQILGEQAERRRGTRERMITSAFKQIWKHQLDLLTVFRVEPDTYEKKNPDGLWELAQYTRESIDASNTVEVEKQAYIDRSIIERERTREAYLDGLIVNDGPIARKRILEKMGLPDDINEDSNLQIDHAKREWVDFVDEGRIPVIDTSLDDPTIKFNMFGIFLKQDEGRRIADEAGWPLILPLITGWEKDYLAMEQLYAQVEALYGPSPDPDNPDTQVQYAKHQELFTQQKQAMDQGMAAGADPTLMPQLPPPPVPPIRIPRTTDQKIMLIWMKLLAQQLPLIINQLIMGQGGLVNPQQLEQKVMLFLRFRAVVEAYKLLMPMPQLNAPGSGATMMPGDKGQPGLQPTQPPQRGGADQPTGKLPGPKPKGGQV